MDNYNDFYDNDDDDLRMCTYIQLFLSLLIAPDL